MNTVDDVQAREAIAGQLVRKLVSMGAPADDAHAIADVAIHAAEEAVKTIQRITATLPGTDKGTAMMIGYQIAEELCRTNGEAVTEHMRQLPGVREVEATIGSEAQA